MKLPFFLRTSKNDGYICVFHFFVFYPQKKYCKTLLKKVIENLSYMKDWHYPYDVHKISLFDSLDVAYIDEGKGEDNPTLLFIHGLGSNLKAWIKWTRAHPQFRTKNDTAGRAFCAVGTSGIGE